MNTLYQLRDDEVVRGEEIEGRIEELEDEQLDAEAEAELKALREIVETIEGYAEDKVRDTTLYRDDYFPAYAEQFAEDIGAVNEVSAGKWPLMHIDWKAAAEDLKQDYTSVEIDGIDFWFR